MARSKTSIVFDEEIKKLVQHHGIDRNLGFARSLEEAGKMWAGPFAAEHEALERVLTEGPADVQKKLRALLSALW